MQVTGFEVEIKRLADAGVLVDTFFLGRGADLNFVWMADQTKGASFALNICTPAGARDLIDNVTARYVDRGQELVVGVQGKAETVALGLACTY